MIYSNNIVFQKFIKELVETLKRENRYRQPNGKQLDIPFLISVLCQDLENRCELYNNFYLDLRDSKGYRR